MLFSVAIFLMFVGVTNTSTGGVGVSRISYLTEKIRRGNLRSIVSASGVLKASRAIKVGSQLSGQISELLVDFNEHVIANQPLARLDSRTYDAQVLEKEASLSVAKAKVSLRKAGIEQAKAELQSTIAKFNVAMEQAGSARARLRESKRDLDRSTILVKRGIVSEAKAGTAAAKYQELLSLFNAAKSQLDVEKAGISSARSNVKRAQAELTNALASVQQQKALLQQVKIELSRATIKSPIDGVVIGRNVEEGQTVAASLTAPTLFHIVEDLSRMEVHIAVSEADIGRVRPGQLVEFAVDAYRDRRFAGSVKQIRKSPREIDNVITYTVVVSAPNAERLLLPGMTATVQIIVMNKLNILRIPNAALRFRPRNYDTSKVGQDEVPVPNRVAKDRSTVVWFLSNSKELSPVRVQLGETDGSATELISGNVRVGSEAAIGIARSKKAGSFFDLNLSFFQ